MPEENWKFANFAEDDIKALLDRLGLKYHEESRTYKELECGVRYLMVSFGDEAVGVL